MSDLVESAVSLQDAHDLAMVDPDFLAALAMPEVAAYSWPPVFRGVWDWLLETVHKERNFDKLALGLPRGFGKSTVIKLFILYCILFTDRKFILVMAATATLAENIIADVFDMLREPNIKAVFGDWELGVEKDTNSVKKFGFRGRNIIVAAIGAGGSVRGLNIKNARPDVMVFDDIQSREDADSQEVSEKLYKWMLGTAMKAKSPTGCMTLFIANMYPTPHSILKKLKHNSQWIKFIAGGILEDGTSLWEELQPIEQLLAEYAADSEAGHPEIFISEVLNDENASVNNLLDVSKLPPYPYDDADISAGSFIVIDPSNDKTNSDAVSIGYFEVHDGKPICMDLLEGRYSPGECIRETLKMGMRRNCTLVFIEANAYQYSLKYWSEQVCIQQGIIGFRFQEIYSGRLSKNSRILTMIKAYSKGELYVHKDCLSLVHNQIAGFNPLKTNNVDGILDLLTYALRIVAEFQHLIAAQGIIAQQEALESNDNFDEWDNSAF